MPLQDWSPTGVYENGAWRAETVFNFDRANDPTPESSTINLKIKDVFDVEYDYEFSEYRLKTYLFFSDTPAEWLNASCYEAIGVLNNNRYTPLTENGTEYNFAPVYQNLSSLPNGEYLFFISFALEGLRVSPSVFWYNIENYVHTVKLVVFEGEVTDMIISPYEEGEKAFTLDPKSFTVRTFNTDTYFQLDAIIKTYDFQSNNFFNSNPKQTIIPQKVVPFKNVSQIVLGRTIHQLMYRFEKPNASFLQYAFANLTLICTEKNFSNDTEVRSQTISDIIYIAGLGRGITGDAFLDFNQKPNRVTPKSFAYLNFILTSRGKKIRVVRNGTNHSVITVDTTTLGKIMCKKVLFSAFTSGDVIDFYLEESSEENNDAPKKTYVVLPEGKYSNMIVWENEFLLQSAIECTGTAQIKPEGEFISQKTFNLFVEVLNHISSSKEVKLFINTGWLTKNDIDTVESLMRSKRAWLVRGDEVIQLRSINKTLPIQDTETELIQFPLEFIINRNYDEETYTL